MENSLFAGKNLSKSAIKTVLFELARSQIRVDPFWKEVEFQKMKRLCSNFVIRVANLTFDERNNQKINGLFSDQEAIQQTMHPAFRSGRHTVEKSRFRRLQ